MLITELQRKNAGVRKERGRLIWILEVFFLCFCGVCVCVMLESEKEERRVGSKIEMGLTIVMVISKI